MTIQAVVSRLVRKPAQKRPSNAPPVEPAGADFTLDPYADLETGARLIGQRAAEQLKAIVQRGKLLRCS